jgi:type VI secretion system protein ImpK
MPGKSGGSSRSGRPVRAVPARGGATRPSRERDRERTPRRGVLETLIAEPAPRRSPPARARLVDACAEWLSLIVTLRQAETLGDAQALRARALELKTQLEDAARRGGFSAADTEAAVFALVGFYDETVLRAPGPAREAWIARPLQLEFYGAMLAGEQFFERLDRMRADRENRIEALEVYYACLAFGFAGKYAFAGPERLKSMLVEIEGDIAAVRGTGRRALAPHAARQDEAGGAATGATIPWYYALGAFVGAVLVTWLLLKLIESIGGASDAATIRRMLPT